MIDDGRHGDCGVRSPADSLRRGVYAVRTAHCGVTAECGLLGKRETSSENRRPLSGMTAAAVFVAIPHTERATLLNVLTSQNWLLRRQPT